MPALQAPRTHYRELHRFALGVYPAAGGKCRVRQHLGRFGSRFGNLERKEEAAPQGGRLFTREARSEDRAIRWLLDYYFTTTLICELVPPAFGGVAGKKARRVYIPFLVILTFSEYLPLVPTFAVFHFSQFLPDFF